MNDEWMLSQPDLVLRVFHDHGGSIFVAIVFVVLALFVIRDLSGRYQARRHPRVYVAGGSSERDAVRVLIDRLGALGIEITGDWTRDPNWDLGRAPTDDELRESALRDLAAIDRADLIWLVVPREKSEGASFESGYAFALKKRLVVSGTTGARNIFALLARPEDRFESHEEALLVVASMKVAAVY